MKKTKQLIGTKTIIILIIIAAAIYFSFYTTNNREQIIEVVRTDGRGFTTTEKEQQFNIESQSFFSGTLEPRFYLLSTTPLTEEETMIMSSTIKNYYEEAVTLTKATIRKNGEVISIKDHLILISEGTSHLYKSQEINMQGKDAQKNVIEITFELTGDKETYQQKFSYEYLDLTICESHKTCKEIGICDFDNLARFSKSTERYCVITCNENDDCPMGQKCENNMCGY